MLHSEYPATRQFCNFGEQRRAVELFRRTISISKRVVDADGIELGVGFLYQPLDIVLVVPTMIISSIGKDEQGAFGVVCTPHLAESQVDSVQKGGPALWGSQHHAALQVF